MISRKNSSFEEASFNLTKFSLILTNFMLVNQPHDDCFLPYTNNFTINVVLMLPCKFKNCRNWDWIWIFACVFRIKRQILLKNAKFISLSTQLGNHAITLTCSQFHKQMKVNKNKSQFWKVIRVWVKENCASYLLDNSTLKSIQFICILHPWAKRFSS